MGKNVKIVVFSPLENADELREAMGKAGAGVIGKYTYCTFSSRGIGRYKPEEGANPAIGSVGKYESVEEERIETVCEKEKLELVISAIRKVHPYEEIAMDIYPLEELC